jgi:hypothetical protein
MTLKIEKDEGIKIKCVYLAIQKLEVFGYLCPLHLFFYRTGIISL